MVHPVPAAPPGTNSEARSTTALSRKIQKLSMFRRGNAMSSVPTMSGMRKLPNAPSSTGIATQKTMIVPCRVTSELY